MSETNESGFQSKLRAEALRLRAVEEKLEEALAIARTLEYSPWKQEIPQAIELQKKEVESIYLRPIFSRALTGERLGWIDQIRAMWVTDRYLAVSAVLVAFLILTLLIFGIFRLAEPPQSSLLFIGHAMAAAGDATVFGLTPKQVTYWAILAVMAIAFFVAMGMTFSHRADTRKLAGDMIKTLLGFFVGAVTKLIE